MPGILEAGKSKAEMILESLRKLQRYFNKTNTDIEQLAALLDVATELAEISSVSAMRIKEDNILHSGMLDSANAIFFLGDKLSEGEEEPGRFLASVQKKMKRWTRWRKEK